MLPIKPQVYVTKETQLSYFEKRVMAWASFCYERARLKEENSTTNFYRESHIFGDGLIIMAREEGGTAAAAARLLNMRRHTYDERHVKLMHNFCRREAAQEALLMMLNSESNLVSKQ